MSMGMGGGQIPEPCGVPCPFWGVTTPFWVQGGGVLVDFGVRSSSPLLPLWGSHFCVFGGHSRFGETPANLFFIFGGCGVLSNREKAATPTPQHLNPLDLLYRLDALLPPESLLVADGGDFVGTAAYIVRPRRPLSWLDPGEDPPRPWARCHRWGHAGDTGCCPRRSLRHAGSWRRLRARCQAVPPRGRGMEGGGHTQARGGPQGQRCHLLGLVSLVPSPARFGSCTVTARWATA